MAELLNSHAIEQIAFFLMLISVVAVIVLPVCLLCLGWHLLNKRKAGK